MKRNETTRNWMEHDGKEVYVVLCRRCGWAGYEVVVLWSGMIGFEN